MPEAPFAVEYIDIESDTEDERPHFEPEGGSPSVAPSGGVAEDAVQQWPVALRRLQDAALAVEELATLKLKERAAGNLKAAQLAQCVETEFAPLMQARSAARWSLVLVAERALQCAALNVGTEQREAAHNLMLQIRDELDSAKTLRAKEGDALGALRSFPRLKADFDRARDGLEYAQKKANADYAGQKERDELARMRSVFEVTRDAYQAALARAQDLMKLGGFPELAMVGVSLYVGEVDVLQLSDFAPTTPVLIAGREVSILRGQRNGTLFALKG
jgi:hypothetical protein